MTEKLACPGLPELKFLDRKIFFLSQTCPGLDSLQAPPGPSCRSAQATHVHRIQKVNELVTDCLVDVHTVELPGVVENIEVVAQR